MKKKYLNIVLGVLLVVIWSSVIYKYFGNKKTETPSVTLNQPPPISFNNQIDKDTFNLVIKNDPFKASKSRFASEGVKKSASKNSKKVSKKPISKKIIWPKITYHGFVKSERNPTKLALIKVNGKLHRKRENETIDNLSVLKAYSDSIIVSINNNNKTINKNE